MHYHLQMTFTRKILTGLFIGIALGLFFGEIVAPLEAGGRIFIGMLQMTVLPYIMLSLIINLGRISWAESRGLLLTLILVFAIFLLLGAIVLLMTPLAFPPIESASFFKTSLVAAPPIIDLVKLYVPSNPFASMANNMVPAVVLFSIFVGIGLSGVPRNGALLDALDVMAEALNKINKLMIQLTPYGVFFIAASTAGTLSLDEVFRLQGFIITYTLLVLVMSFIIMPMFLTALTPFKMKDLLGTTKDSLITIFATAKIIVLLPQLIDDILRLFKRYDLDNEVVEQESQIALPLAYPFPHLGTYVILMFIAFAAWYVGRPLDASDQLTLQGASIFSSFISPLVGIPFLLDIMRLPADVMELFIVSTVYTDRVRVVLGAMHLIVMTVIVLAIRRGVFQPDWRKVATASVVSIVALIAVLLGTRAYLTSATAGEYHGHDQLLQIQWRKRAVEAVTYNEALPPVDTGVADLERLERISARGTLRVGYLPDSLPWAFVNEQGEVTGFDIELANLLAMDLGVKLEIVRIQWPQINELLDRGQIDIVMSGITRTPERLHNYHFAGSPLNLTMGLLVADHQRKRFGSVDDIAAMKNLSIGVVQNDDAFQRSLKLSLPHAEIIGIESPRPFLRGQRSDIDAVLYSAEGGSAWTLIYPDYSIVVPQPAETRLPTGFIVSHDEDDWAEYVDEWVNMQKLNGSVNRLFEHWIQGRGAESTEPRWSVIRNVLGWVN
jgi:Na+/H+-dicarboxylate symporter/ABC-type amino acid transport substrate-binding protein